MGWAGLRRIYEIIFYFNIGTFFPLIILIECGDVTQCKTMSFAFFCFAINHGKCRMSAFDYGILLFNSPAHWCFQLLWIIRSRVRLS